VSLNNMGCFYRRCKKLHAALRCLEQALEIELRYAKDLSYPHFGSPLTLVHTSALQMPKT
jgi:hypothetical protein